MSKRAIRRHHRERIRARTRRILKFQGWDPEYIEKACRYRADNFTACSCWMCGNPRRAHRWENPLTIQERRAFQDPVDLP